MRRLIFLLLLAVNVKGARAQADVSVDFLTGTASVNIPLFHIRDGDIQIPVALSYVANGVKISGSDGWLGHNWSISVEASVSREVRGLPDDYKGSGTNIRKGWLHGDMGIRIKNYSVVTDNDPTTCSDEASNWNFLNTFGYHEDTEPDLFVISAPGLSLEFYFDENKQPQVVPYQDVLIEPAFDPVTGKITSFTITDQQGLVYTFGAVESISQSVSANTLADYCIDKRYKFDYPGIGYNTSWKLTQLASPISGVINYIYKDVSLRGRDYRGQHIFPLTIKNDHGSLGEVLSYSSSSASLKFLERITTSFSEIQFESVPKHQDPHGERLITIKVVDKRSSPEKLVKAYAFSYDFVAYEGSNLDFRGIRYSLKALQEKNAAGRTLPAYTFDYISDNAYPHLPGFDSNLKDEWEFYKDPSLPYHETVQRGSLRRVNFPLGGYTALFYEPHQYFDPAYGSSTTGAGLRVRKMITHDGISSAGDIIKEFEYVKTDGTSSGKLLHKPAHGISTVVLNRIGSINVARYRDIQQRVNAGTMSGPIEKYFTVTSDQELSKQNLISGSAVAYERVIAKQKNGGRSVYEFDLPGTHGEASANNNEWEASQVLIARPATGNSTCYERGYIPIGIHQYPYPPNPNYSFARGAIKKITDLNEDGTKVREVTYKYKRIYGGSGIRKIYGLALESLPTYLYNGSTYTDARMFVYSKYEINTDVRTVLEKKIDTLYYSADLARKTTAITEYLYDSPHHRELTAVITTNSDQTERIKRFKYVKDFPVVSAADAQTQALVKLRTARRNLLVESTSSLGGSVEKFFGASLTLFQNLNERIVPHQTLVFESAQGDNTFLPSNTVTSGSNTIFQYDAGKYPAANTILAVDSSGNVTETVGPNRQPASVVYGFKNTLPVIAVQNARLSEIGFSDFETSTTADFATWTSPVFTAGRTGTKALTFPVGSAYKLTRSISHIKSQQYILSCWLNSTANGNLTIKLRNGTTDLVSPVQVPFTSFAGWKYYRLPINASTLPTTFTVEIMTSTGIVIDDILFYPGHADIVTYTYDIPFGKASETDGRGVTTFYTYDEWGRLNVVYDQDKNIIKKFDHNVRP